jgi:hypothetical protein
MPIQFDGHTPTADGAIHTQPNGMLTTIAGLFESDIDTRLALRQLHRESFPAQEISIVFRTGNGDTPDASQEHGAVVSSITAMDLEPFTDWITGFASVIVPERGTFLVAGPIGASIAGDHVIEDGDTSAHSPISAVLTHFGFSRDEASYMDSRLASGALLVSVTTSQPGLQDRAIQTFASESAVYIPHAATDPRVAESAAELLVAPPEHSTNGDVVVTDAVARFFRYCDSGRADEIYIAYRGRHVRDPNDREIGVIAEFIAETVRNPDTRTEVDEVRYVIVAFGGVLRIGRHYVAVPIELIELEQDPARVRVGHDLLRSAPHYDRTAPFSRAEEYTVCAYFGTRPYWSESVPVH